jgi:hypothetical protein
VSDGFGRERVGFVLAVLMCVVAFVGTVAQGSAGGGASGDGERAAREAGNLPASGQETTGTPSPADAPAPRDLSFLCAAWYDTDAEARDAHLDAATKEEAEKAALDFVRFTYGYASADAGAYETTVGKQGVRGCFWQSDVGDEADAREEMVRQGGEQSAAEDLWFFAEPVGFYVTDEERVRHPSGAEYLRIQGNAVWLARHARTEPTASEVFGVQQSLTLAKKVGSEEWKVAYGEYVDDYPDSDYEHAVDETIEEL